jgi:hypothetical protein
VNNKQKIRLFFLIVITFVALQLFNSWEQRKSLKIAQPNENLALTSNLEPNIEHDLPAEPIKNTTAKNSLDSENPNSHSK